MAPPLGPTDAFSPWPSLIAARMGVASDGSVWIYSKGNVIQVAAAGTIPHPMMAGLGVAAPADALVADPEPEPEPEPEPHHRGRRR